MKKLSLKQMENTKGGLCEGAGIHCVRITYGGFDLAVCSDCQGNPMYVENW